MNESGDSFLLATTKNAEDIAGGVHLICKRDEHHSRWIHETVLLRIVELPKSGKKAS